MVSRVFKIKPKRLYWQAFIEAWQNSGTSQLSFCKERKLDYKTFRRWRKMFEENGGYKLEPIKKKRKKRTNPYHTGYRGKARQAFWAMHVEALWWSGLSVPSYARAHRLSRYTLAKWRDKLMAEPEGINWRNFVHPSARPEINPEKLSPMTKPMTKQLSPGTDPSKDSRSNRRNFTPTQKRAIVLETNLPNITVSDVARRYNLATSVLFRWRRDFDMTQEEAAKLASVQIIDKTSNHAAGDKFLQKLLPSRQGMIAIELADGQQVFVPEGTDPEEVKAYITSREKQS